MSDTDLDEDFMPRPARSRWPTKLLAALVVIGIVIIGAWLSFSKPPAPDDNASNLPAFKLPQRMTASSAETRLTMDGRTADTDIEARVQGLAQAAAKPQAEVELPPTPSDETNAPVTAIGHVPITAAAIEARVQDSAPAATKPRTAVAQPPIREKKVEPAKTRTTIAEKVPVAKAEEKPQDSAVSSQGQSLAQSAVQDQGTPAPLLEDLEVILAAAAADVRRDRLTSPAGSNAFERYQQVLAREPGNEKANSGLRDIVARYIVLAQRVAKDGRFEKAESFLKRAQSIGVSGDELTSAREQLAKLQANQ